MTVKISGMTAATDVPTGALFEIEDAGETRSLSTDLLRPVYSYAYAPDMLGNTPLTQDGLTVELGGQLFCTQTRTPVDEAWIVDTKLWGELQVKSAAGGEAVSPRFFVREMFDCLSANNDAVRTWPQWWLGGPLGLMTGVISGVDFSGYVDRDGYLHNALGELIELPVLVNDAFAFEWAVTIQDD